MSSEVPPKKKKLVKKAVPSNPLHEKIWLAGHVATVAFGGLTILWLLLRLPNKYYLNSIFYRLALLSAVVSLTLTFSHKFGLRYLPSATALIADQNFQYLVLAIIWMFTFKSVFKIIPYLLISLLQLATFKGVNVILSQGSTIATIIAHDELVLIVYLVVRTLFFRGASGYQLTVFLVFYWLRIRFNKETKNLFRFLILSVDGRISSVKNEKVLKAWGKVKLFLDEKLMESVTESSVTA